MRVFDRSRTERREKHENAILLKSAMCKVRNEHSGARVKVCLGGRIFEIQFCSLNRGLVNELSIRRWKNDSTKIKLKKKNVE